MGTMMSRDEAFELLRSERRRTILRHLDDSDGSVPIDELTAVIASEEVADDVSPKHRRRIAIALHHNDLPKLSATSVLTYDRSERVVSLQNKPEPVFELLYSETE